MDPLNQVVHSEHLPDESNIERLFPKCPFKQQQQQQQQREPSGRRRQRGRQNRSATASGGGGSQQHSRRELEGRRGGQQDRRFRDANREGSSGSSDEQQQQHRVGSRMFKRTNSGSTTTTSRRSGKYMASQSLLQQLQRSQSTYSHHEALEQTTAKPTSTTNTNDSDRPALAPGHERGIVKSTSASFPIASTNNISDNAGEPHYNINNNNNNKQPTSSNQLINYKTSPEAGEDDDSAARGVNESRRKLDNISQSDLLFDNELKTSTSNTSNGFDIVKSQRHREKPSDYMDGDGDESFGELINKLDKRNNRTKFLAFSEDDDDEDVENADDNNNADDDGINVNVRNDTSQVVNDDLTTENAELLTPATSVAAPTADLRLRNSADKIGVIKRQEDPDLITINEPGDEEEGGVVSLEKETTNTSQFRNETTGQRDEDQYINLFVYDNNLPAPLTTTTTTTTTSNPSKAQKGQPTLSEKPNNSKLKTRRPKNKQPSNRDNRTTISNRTNSTKLIECASGSEAGSFKRNKADNSTNIIDYEDECNNVPGIEPNESSSSSAVSVASKYRQHQEQSTTILPIHHSQQLLTTKAGGDDEDDDDENSVIRNDASIEELCSNDDLNEETRKDVLVKRRREETSKTTNASYTTLETVDEKAEINLEEEKVEEEEEGLEEEEEEGDENLFEKDNFDRTSEMMPTNQHQQQQQLSGGLKKKACVPPGYPKRIGFISSNLTGDDSKTLKQSNDVSTSSRDQQQPSTVTTGAIKPIKVVEPTNQRVKFDESNLVSVKYHNNSDHQQAHQPTNSINNNRNIYQGAQNGGLCKRSSGEHHQAPLMPSISETNYESDEPTSPASTRNELKNQDSYVESSERDLINGMNKISLVNSSSYSQQLDTPPKPPLQNNLNSNPASSPEHFQITAKTELPQAIQSSPPPPNQVEPMLRHHKLPNESSHFSTVRTVGLSTGNQEDNSNTVSSRAPSHVQFNTLSDADSGADDQLTSSVQQSQIRKRISAATAIAKKCDLSANNHNTSGSGSSLLGTPSSSSRISNDDDLIPATKTALIFPRLDEGLSSEAESYEDDGEDDEEKAMDGDIDADDDDDDEEEEDEDIDNDPNSSSADLFMRQQQQQQQGRNHNRLSSGQLQQSSDPLELHHLNKSGGYNHSSVYVNQDSLEHNDLDRTTATTTNNNYSSHNGQSNYWMATNQQQQQQQQQASSSQPQQQQFMSRNNISGGNSLQTKQASGSSFERDETKATNRLSSDTDNETDRLLGTQRNDQLKQMTNSDVINSNSSAAPDLQIQTNKQQHQSANSKEVLIEGVLFNVKFLGTTESLCEGQTSKEERVKQAEMAVHEVRFLNGEGQPAIEVQLFISTEKIMVLDDKHRKILMDHSLKTISYIADIGDFIVLIVKKKYNASTRTNTSCHVFESSESHTITKSIDQAFQVAYADLLKAHGNGDGSGYLPKETDYQEVLNSQEMSTDELEMFARKENQREVIVPKEKGEILGLSIVESGWGSVLPTVVIASLKPEGPAYRCKKLSVGDQILSINGISLVGLPLADCQEILRKTKNQRVARFSVVPCPITVEVKIKRPDTKYQLGFSVQNGVICSLLRGGIAERGGVRVGHRIMSINGTTVVNVPHEKIVSLLASSVGEIKMKTCLTSLYRLILGEENPVHF